VLLDQLRRHIEDFARVLMGEDKYVPAASLLRTAADDQALGVFKPQFLFQLSQAYEFGNKTAQALAAIGEARRTSNHPLLHYQEAWIHYHARQYDKAVPMFEQVIKQFPDDKSIVRRCRFSLSQIYVEQGDIAKGERVLEEVFAEEPDNPSVNNDLGYLYADQGKKLDQAEKMIRKALKADPENSAYLDSMGWVLFKRGKYTEALGFLKKASADRDGEDATILDHLGDCLDKLKQKKPAIKNWKKALEVARKAERPDKKLIERIEKKLKDAGQKAKPPKKK
jgi:tetratricopeptide (TPR) repeat protein